VQLAELQAFTHGASGSEDWRSFWLLGQPFTMNLAEPDDDERQFQSSGWSTVQSIVICCHARGQTGDVLLAFLAARVAEIFDGLIAFGGQLSTYTTNPSVLTLDGRYASDELGDVFTPAFLKYWAGTPEFQMCN
jgi:hypothetical protein